MIPNRKMRHGFTLIELSVVLLIIGILIGGVMVGRDMLRASQLNRVLADKDRLITAMNNFRTKYNAWPGDMRNATDYWGTASGGCPNGTRSGTQTCNGDGDGFIGSVWNGGDPRMVEMYAAMQHMKNAGFISGAYSGYVNGVAGYYAPAQIGFNSPVTAIDGGTFMIFGSNSPNYSFYDAYLRNAILFGASNNGDVAAYPILSGGEAQMMDKKVDDGMPGQGKVISPTGSTSPYAPNCTTSNAALTATYNTAKGSTEVCSLFFNN